MIFFFCPFKNSKQLILHGQALYEEEVRNSYLIREISECPAALVTMLISVSGLGSAGKKENNHITEQQTAFQQYITVNERQRRLYINRPESIVIDFGSFTG